MDIYSRLLLISNAILLLSSNSFEDDFLIGETNVIHVKLFHAFNSDLNYEPRGSITISGVNSAPIVRQEPLSIEEVAALKKSSSDGTFYYLKAVAHKSLDDQNPIKTSTTFVKACSLYESSLSDVLTVTLDANNQFLSVSASALNPHCIPQKSAFPTKLSNFNTTVVVMPTVVSNGPDTQTYIQRLEEEKAQKMRGDKADNRSFFAKYWMYIVPVVIFLLISGAANPEAGGGGR